MECGDHIRVPGSFVAIRERNPGTQEFAEATGAVQ